jgi:hypothetical protein
MRSSCARLEKIASSLLHYSLKLALLFRNYSTKVNAISDQSLIDLSQQISS